PAHAPQPCATAISTRRTTLTTGAPTWWSTTRWNCATCSTGHFAAAEGGMFTYVTLGTNALPRAVAFYDAVLAPLGLQRCDTGSEAGWEQIAGWGSYAQRGQVELALWLCTPFDGAPATAGN